MSKTSVLIAESDPTMAKFLMTNLKLLRVAKGLSNRRPRTRFAVQPYSTPISPLLPGSCPATAERFSQRNCRRLRPKQLR